jgi:hypothetical protein
MNIVCIALEMTAHKAGSEKPQEYAAAAAADIS